jgi:Flp pilus assembly pilin Flp
LERHPDNQNTWIRWSADFLSSPYRLHAASYWASRARVRYARFERDGSDPDLDAAIDAGRRAVAATRVGEWDHAMYLSNLGVALRTRFEHAGDRADLDAAIDAGRRAAAATRSGHPDLAGYLSNLGTGLSIRFEQAGDATDLDQAIDAGRQAVAVTRPGDPDLAGYLSNLGAALRTRFERAGDAADLDAAIDAGRQAVAATPPGRPDHANCLSNLGLSLQMRFERAGDGADLDEAIDAGRQAVAATPPGHRYHAAYQANLGAALRTRFERAGDIADLNQAIDAGRQAVAATPPGRPGRANCLSNLGVALRTRFERAGDAADLDAAIDAGRQAVAATLPGHRYHTAYMANFGGSLLARFMRAGDRADLDEAIDAGRRAVAAIHPGDRNLAVCLTNLGIALSRRFQLGGDAADLDEAIDTQKRAVAATSPSSPNLARYLSNLASALVHRSELTGDVTDLDHAVDAQTRAVAASPEDHPNRAMFLSNLGAFRRVRFELAADSADLDAALNAGRQAVVTTPPGHPNHAMFLLQVGMSFSTRFEHVGNGADLDTAITCWQQASQVRAGAPAMRLDAARRWGEAAARAGRIREAAAGYAASVELLPQVAWHGLNRATRKEQLAQWSGLAADAAAYAVLDGRPARAVELLEQGRSVLWAQAVNLRSDLGRLAEKAPDLAGRLDSIRMLLDSPVPDHGLLASGPAADSTLATDHALQEAADLRRRMAREWDDVLTQVRSLDGFEHFLTAIPYAELAAAAAGPVVILNASSHGCHALIVEAARDQPGIVDLPELSLDTAIAHATTMLQTLAGAAVPGTLPGREKDRHAIFGILDWLWDVIAEPVLSALGYDGIADAGHQQPRLWWCPTGPLSLLPIHAAGHHPRRRAAEGGDCVSDRVISSYTPTLTALTRAQRPPAPAPVRQVFVGMPATPGQPPLPAVTTELNISARHFPAGDGNRQLTGPQATRGAVLAAIAACSWAHFACHASQQHADPDRSGFALWDATLTITDLAAQPAQRRDLAFLSACQTATGSARHLDEAIHLAAAMQFLGYRHVIATLWTITDSSALRVADAVYTALTSGGRPDPDRAAEALHRAVRSLREANPANPLLWAPYVHLGS